MTVVVMPGAVVVVAPMTGVGRGGDADGAEEDGRNERHANDFHNLESPESC
jgi:hypothetical protein